MFIALTPPQIPSKILLQADMYTAVYNCNFTDSIYKSRTTPNTFGREHLKTIRGSLESPKPGNLSPSMNILDWYYEWLFVCSENSASYNFELAKVFIGF